MSSDTKKLILWLNIVFFAIIVFVMLLFAETAKGGDFHGHFKYGFGDPSYKDTEVDYLFYDEAVADQETFTTEIRLDYAFKLSSVPFIPSYSLLDEITWTIYGNTETWSFSWNLIDQTPYRAYYEVGTKVRYKRLFAGVEHYCNHYVESLWLGEEDYNRLIWLRNRPVGRGTFAYIGVDW
jgi:hypothetical protein